MEIALLALNLLLTARRLYGVETDEKYLETVGWYSHNRSNLREGQIPKAISLLKKLTVLEITDKSIVAEVPSESSDKTYTVKVIVVPLEYIDFYCNCKWGEFRARPCKHVLATTIYPLKDVLNVREELIVRGESFISYRDLDTHRILTMIHTALNKSAYLRTRLGEAIA